MTDRLDVYLSKKLSMTRSHAQKLIAEGLITVDGEHVKASYKLTGGEVIDVEEVDSAEVEYLPEDLPLDTLYEDANIIVVNKARGMTVHPAETVKHGTLVNALLYHCKDLSGINGIKRPGIVHRLDKDTSGVMVVAKTDKAHISLAAQIKDKVATRTYLAIVHGVLADNAGIITGAIGRDKVDRKKMAVVPNGKPAVTEFKVLERFKDFTYVECKLQTGRTHQIRVHMTAIGHPLLGDTKYTARKNPFDIRGQALHSHTLSLIHPTTGKLMKFTAPLPDDMKNILDQLKACKGMFTNNTPPEAPSFSYGEEGGAHFLS
ncbi:MAG: RluA family pseudouridine synthase [Selenomonadaceae bacterium]|nr:RluA family pseudouridine synthase [Selenomonadaceae bacterium]